MRSRLIILSLFLMVLCTSTFSTPEANAAPTWREGVVTKKPWTDQRSRIEIDQVTFTFMPHATLYLRKNTYRGGYNEEPIALWEASVHSRVSILAEGHNIHQLVILR